MQKLQLLFLTNIPEDAELLYNALNEKGLDFNLVPVQSITELVPAIAHQNFDAILTGNLKPESDAISVLKKLKDFKIRIPFIFIADDLLKDDVVHLMKEGASDCMQKDNLGMLSQAITEAILKSKQENEHRRHIDKILANEQLLLTGTRMAHLGCWESDLVNNTERWSEEQYKILGMEPGKRMRPLENIIRQVHPEDVMSVTQLISDTIKNLGRQKFDCRIIVNESIKYISVEMIIERDARGIPVRINGCLWDDTEAHIATLNEKKTISDLVQRNKDLEQFAYIISHNLRAPVANIVGVSNALYEDNLTEAEQKEFTGALFTSVKKLDTLIIDLNHILQVKQRVSENMEVVNFTQLVDEIKSSIGVFLKDQFIMILGNFDEVPEMWTLKSYMRSILYNLISNSIKYRKPELAPVVEIKSRRNRNK